MKTQHFERDTSVGTQLLAIRELHAVSGLRPYAPVAGEFGILPTDRTLILAVGARLLSLFALCELAAQS